MIAYSRAQLAALHHLDSTAVRRLVRSGRLVRIRRGSYMIARSDDPLILTPKDQILAAAPHLRPGSVFSHESAAIVHGLPLWRREAARVCATRNGDGNGHVRQFLHLRRCCLPLEHVTEVNGLPVTTKARTAIDLARLLPYESGVAVLDAARSSEVDLDELRSVLELMRTWPGAGKAARALAFSTNAAESPAESVSRVRMAEAGLPRPILQYELLDERGNLALHSDDGRAAWRVRMGGSPRVSDSALHWPVPCN